MALLSLSLKKSPLFLKASNQVILLVKALCLANVAKFFLLPIVIWKTQQSDFVVQLNFILFIGYFISGLIHVHSGKEGFRMGNILWIKDEKMCVKQNFSPALQELSELKKKLYKECDETHFLVHCSSNQVLVYCYF